MIHYTSDGQMIPLGVWEFFPDCVDKAHTVAIQYMAIV